jgi:hypothetical protein
LSFCDHQRDPGAVTGSAKLQAERITGTADTCVTFELEQYKLLGAAQRPPEVSRTIIQVVIPYASRVMK